MAGNENPLAGWFPGSGGRSWRVMQVSTHGHDRPLDNTLLQKIMMPRWTEFARKGLKHRDNVRIEPGEYYEFPVMEGPGEIVNIWCTFTPFKLSRMISYQKYWPSRKALRLQVFFDDDREPSVDAPIGDFFGVGFGEYKEYQSRFLEETSGGYVCRFPMPFAREAKVRILNTSKDHACTAFYGAITFRHFDEVGDLDFSGDGSPFYFHARYREEKPTTPRVPYKILDVEGEGWYVGLVLNQQNARRGDGFRFLEGNTKIFVDGEKTPSIEFTGTEDLFQGAWYYISGEFNAPYSGLTVRSLARLGPARSLLLAPLFMNKASQYRFHEQDAVPFKKSCLAFIHHGEFDEIPTNQSSITYFYAKHPVNIDMGRMEAGGFLDEYYS